MIGRVQLIEGIRVVAATEPSYIYHGGAGGCTYRPNRHNRCGCLVGEALAEAGVPLEKLIELDNAPFAHLPGTSPVGWGDPECRRILHGLVTEAALASNWIIYVQSCQDDEYTWGDAVREADEQARSRGWAMA